MNTSLPLIALCGALACFSAFAAEQPANVANYTYDTPLDIAKVISLTPASNADRCEVGIAHMVYVDHKGQTHEIAFRQMGDCSL
ncbi:MULTISPECIES: DUF2790 domain-containing protein [unclassified Pseudomonas]|uniref:DUF2790 domain-containing protein n=1 Tax=unclassified Pseudomonas TaxID=196821 RepID=UPI0035C080E1